MSNVGKATDGMLDTISELQHHRDETRAALEFYTEAKLIPAEVASHLWSILTGLEVFEPEGEEHGNVDNLVSSSQPER